MLNMLQQLAIHANAQPDKPAIESSNLSLDYQTLYDHVLQTMERLSKLNIDSLALDLDNGAAWAIIDLASMAADISTVPIPPFFSPDQVCHALSDTAVSCVITDAPKRFIEKAAGITLTETATFELCGKTLYYLQTHHKTNKIPKGIHKVTYTSGTTAEPKGVLLSWKQMEPVITSLAKAVAVKQNDRHVVLMPLAVLLENMAGLYLPLWCGASVALPSLIETGLLGAAGLESERMVETLEHYAATTAIFSPQMLQGMVEHISTTGITPPSLRFIALGGAAVSKRLLQSAKQLGIPVFEGYGLSESASVATLNHPGAQRIGSVGKPLPHLQLCIAKDGEVLVRGNSFLGYLNDTEPRNENDWWHTGDIGRLDDEGFLYLLGRRRNIFITAFGRNVSPEWVERELILEPVIIQAALFGEARPWNLALIVPSLCASQQEIETAIQRTNQNLPDYARIGQWLMADAPFNLVNGQLSGTGRLRRQTIYQHYCSRIEAQYQQELIS
ncbi:MAG: AMP-binding protein [Candidatus Thiodiazotropha sp.]|jgi:long-chain acyl-CoA synthetase